MHIVSPASAKAIAELEEAVERFCPILNLLRKPQAISGSVNLVKPRAEKAKPAEGATAAGRRAKAA